MHPNTVVLILIQIDLYIGMCFLDPFLGMEKPYTRPLVEVWWVEHVSSHLKIFLGKYLGRRGCSLYKPIHIYIYLLLFFPDTRQVPRLSIRIVILVLPSFYSICKLKSNRTNTEAVCCLVTTSDSLGSLQPLAAWLSCTPSPNLTQAVTDSFVFISEKNRYVLDLDHNWPFLMF